VVRSGEPPFTPDQLAQAGTALAAGLTASPGTAASLLTGSQQQLGSPGGGMINWGAVSGVGG
jgi:hypothetical protein